MFKYGLIIFLFCSLIKFNGYGQDITLERDLLGLIYYKIAEENAHLKLQKQLNNDSIFLVQDPVTGIETVVIPSSIHNNANNDFLKLPESEQIKILGCDRSVIQLKDTLVIVDTSVFFPKGDFVFKEKTAVIRVVQEDNKNYANRVFLFTVGVRGNNLIIALNNIEQDNLLYTYYFNLSQAKVVLQKTSVTYEKRY